jgi:UDP-N-acetylmuramoylalanine--D-glutamate ligase
MGFGRAPRPSLSGTFLENGRIQLDLGDGIEEICAAEDVPLRGEHTLLNVLAACAAAAAAGLSTAAMAEGIRTFRGLPHRLELIRTVHGADWYDDSIATAPERTLAALRSFSQPIVLLAGGRDKDLPWDEFAAFVRSGVDHLILFGEAAAKIQAAVEADRGQRPYSMDIVADLDAAVQAAVRRAQAGDAVLLSPGGTSYDAFADFAARGERFRQLVERL